MISMILILSLIYIVFLLKIASASNVGLLNNLAWQQNLSKVRYSSTSFGDVDNDGDLDLVLTGCLSDGGNRCENGAITKYYTNNGTSFIEDLAWQQNLTGIGWSSTSLGDIDNDGDLDLALSGCTNASDNGATCNENIISKIYINNGTTLTENLQWQNNLTGTFDGHIAFGDVNNDGKLDLLQIGRTIGSKIAKVYINNGTTLTENLQWQNNLTGLDDSSLSFADIDNDGDLDLVLTGEDNSSVKKTKIYINNGTSLVESSQWQSQLLQLSESSSIFGDINNDGDLDYIIMGCCDYLYIYENNGTSLIGKQKDVVRGDDTLIGIFAGSLAFGDYDNDGYIDFAGIGRENDRNRIYWNNITRENNFSVDNIAGKDLQSDDLYLGSIAWADLDNDNDLDIIATGLNISYGLLSRIYINNNTIPNTKPLPPSTNFSSNYSISNAILNLSWGNGSDVETNTSGLYYNLMIGNSTNNHTIVSGVYGGSSGGGDGGGPSAGYFGNMMQRKSIRLKVNLSNGTYYWYVQTIDTGLAKSNWSERQSFTVGTDTTSPVLSSISSSVTSSTATITWTTDESANSSVYYGTTISTISSSSSSSLVTSHSVSLSGLPASTLYYYNVSSCDASGNCNTSSRYNFTTSSAPADGGTTSGGGGGGGTTTTYKTYAVTDEQLLQGYTQILSKDDKIKFSINNKNHSLLVNSVNEALNYANLTLSSTPFNFLIYVNETKKFELTNDNFYDLLVKLNNLVDNKANLTIKQIYEKIEVKEEEKVGESREVGEEERKEEKPLDVKKYLVFWVIILIVIIIILITYSRKHIKYKRWKKWTLLV